MVPSNDGAWPPQLERRHTSQWRAWFGLVIDAASQGVFVVFHVGRGRFIQGLGIFAFIAVQCINGAARHIVQVQKDAHTKSDAKATKDLPYRVGLFVGGIGALRLVCRRMVRSEAFDRCANACVNKELWQR